MLVVFPKDVSKAHSGELEDEGAGGTGGAGEAQENN